MAIERITKWEPVFGVDRPPADISFTYLGRDILSVTMHFSHTLDFPGQGKMAPRVWCLPKKDLVITFKGAIAAVWELDEFGSLTVPLRANDPDPVQLPRLSGVWEKWSYPLLKVEHSAWLATHEARHPIATNGRVHIVLIALNDLLHVIALPQVETTWLEVPDV